MGLAGSPAVQLEADVAPITIVVILAKHATHGGVGTVTFPPLDQKPRLQTVHGEPP